MGPATSLHAHPLFPRVLCAGYGGGGVAVFHSSARRALRCWPAAASPGAAVVSVRWSSCRPSAIFVVDSAGVLSVVDLLSGDGPPAALSDRLCGEEGDSADSVTAMEVTSLPVSQAASMRRQAVVVACASGTLRTLLVEGKVPLLTPGEDAALDALLCSPYYAGA